MIARLVSRSPDLPPRFPSADIFSIAPALSKDQDPYALVIQALLPTGPPQSFYPITIGFGIVYGIAGAICTLVIIYSTVSTRSGWRNDVWLFRKCHTTHSTASVPYLVPNGGLVLAICQFVGCVAFEIFIVLSYLVSKYPERMYGPYHAFFQITMWLPGFYGFLFNAFSSFYVIISSADTESLTFLKKPMTYNILLIFIPIYATFQALSWGIADFIVIYKQVQAFTNFLKLSESASIQWNLFKEQSDFVNTKLEISKAYEEVEKFISQRLTIRLGSTISWMPLSFGLLSLYVYTTFSLFKRINELSQCSKIDSNKKSSDKTFPMSLIPHLSEPPNEAIIEKQRAYRFLLCHCVFMSFCILWNAGVGIMFLCPVPSKITGSNWLLSEESICLGGGSFLSIGMSFQNWRIMSEGRRKPITEIQKNQNNDNPLPRPQIITFEEKNQSSVDF